MFAPTEGSAANLRREAIDAGRIFVTGNTVVDALELVKPTLRPPAARRFPGRPLVLVTVHRRESFGEPILGICEAIRTLALEAGDSLEFLWPVHPNPNVDRTVRRVMADVPNVTLTSPLDYFDFLGALSVARLALSDSGGVQEEAPSFACPVVVLRNHTERPEGIDAGWLELVGTRPEKILAAARARLAAPAGRPAGASEGNPYGDGRASERIAEILERS